MRLKDNVNYQVVGEFNITDIIHELSVLDSNLWNMTQYRQTMFTPHKQTKSIFVNDIDIMWDGVGYPIVKHPTSERLSNLTQTIITTLEKQFGGRVGKAVYINLPAGQNVSVHKDGGYYLRSVHRFHIPIITNPSVEFFLNGEIINMRSGTCYEINNVNDHGVENKGDADRIHLMVDVIPMSAFKS